MIWDEEVSRWVGISEWKFHGGRGGNLRGAAAVSCRKLGASLWQLAVTEYDGGVRWQCEEFGRLGLEFCSSLPIHELSMEGATKWDDLYSNAPGNANHFRGLKSRETTTTSLASDDNQTELIKAQKQIKELESERERSRTKLKNYIKKLNEERASWMRTELKKTCAEIKDLKNEIKRERTNSKKMDILNSKLQCDIAKAKSSSNKFMHNWVKEKKARKFLEDVCNELAKEIVANKAEIEAIKNRCTRVQEEIAEERKMLQMAEVWREERAQMKLADAKLILENKYHQMNNLISELKDFLRSSNVTTYVNETNNAMVLRQPFSYTFPNSDNMVVVIKDHNQITETEHCFSDSEEINYKDIVARDKSYTSQESLDDYESSKISSVSLKRLREKGPSTLVEGGLRQLKSIGHGNPHIVRAMKGHTEWPRGIKKHGLKSKSNHLEAKLERQKMLLRNVVKCRS
ncbi:hypothetical protein ACJIZ3_006604 [Penstemon smallii]|uniref:Uncharacterized protein n=1 Tax=Penstemon smallii TaxID=265156 RepID=A0ABD3S850_9LAMI